MQTSGQAAVAQKAAEVEPGTLRHQVLLVAQKFKSSWVELGALLVKVRNAKLWEEWGFKSFEDYCGKELRIKRQTALKLTNSYAFLARHEQELIEPERHGRSSQQEKIKEPPAFEVVSVLADAEGRGQLSEKEYQSLRESIWDDERPAPAVARDLAQRFPAPAGSPFEGYGFRSSRMTPTTSIESATLKVGQRRSGRFHQYQSTKSMTYWRRARSMKLPNVPASTSASATWNQRCSSPSFRK